MKKVILCVLFALNTIQFSFASELNETINSISKSEIINSEGEVATIAEKISKITSISYQMLETIAVFADQPLPRCIAEDPGVETSKIWQKKGYSRRDIHSPASNSHDRIFLRDPKNTYIYSSFSNETELKEASSWDFPIGFDFGIFKKNANSFKVIGTDIVDGKQCILLESTMDAEDKKYHSKIWIWKDKGVPIRKETNWTEMQALQFKTVTRYVDFDFQEIPDEVFDATKIPMIAQSKIIKK